MSDLESRIRERMSFFNDDEVDLTPQTNLSLEKDLIHYIKSLDLENERREFQKKKEEARKEFEKEKSYQNSKIEKTKSNFSYKGLVGVVLLGCAGVFYYVNKEEPKENIIVPKEIIEPIVKKEIPIKVDPYSNLRVLDYSSVKEQIVFGDIEIKCLKNENKYDVYLQYENDERCLKIHSTLKPVTLKILGRRKSNDLYLNIKDENDHEFTYFELKNKLDFGIKYNYVMFKKLSSRSQSTTTSF